MHISTILDQIDLGSMALPEFQRGYVWNREQVRGLMHSLYRRHPVGSLLVWLTKTDHAKVRHDQPLPPGTVKLILDGQQRITSLYGIIRGKSPQFFEGNAQAFAGLYFNLDDETFSFYSPLKMKDDPRWIDVTALMRDGLGTYLKRVAEHPDLQPRMGDYLERLNQIDGIRKINLHIEEVAGEDKTIDVVVDIFNRVNSGGTKLSKGDLALAKVCAEWPEARDEMRKRLEKWRKAGFIFRLELLLRCVNTILTGEAKFEHLQSADMEHFRDCLQRAERRIDAILNLISSRLGLDHDRVLGSRYSFPLMARYLDQRGGKFASQQERDKLLYWYVHTFLWGRYAGSTETILDQDLALIEKADGALDRLIERLRQQRGELRLQPSDFLGWSKGARFYPMLYMLTRVWKARDWESDIELRSHLLGHLSRLELHHIFPKALLYKRDYTMGEVNALANFTFLTQETNLLVSDKDPAEYLPKFAKKNPGALESHWIPMDPALWRVERYRDFLAARRELLAQAANDFLDSLRAGEVPEEAAAPSVLEREAEFAGGYASTEEEDLLVKINEWVVAQGLPEGEFLHQITNPETNDLIAVLDLAWPDGLQEGLSQPVALLINEGREVEEAANLAGFRFFTDADTFKAYVNREILALEEARSAAE